MAEGGVFAICRFTLLVNRLHSVSELGLWSAICVSFCGFVVVLLFSMF